MQYVDQEESRWGCPGPWSLPREYLEQHKVPPEAISFEITEAVALGDLARTVRLISELRAAGCGVGLEDFRNGLTSFAYLRALVVDYVKISGHYVRGVVDDGVAAPEPLVDAGGEVTLPCVQRSASVPAVASVGFDLRPRFPDDA